MLHLNRGQLAHNALHLLQHGLHLWSIQLHWCWCPLELVTRHSSIGSCQFQYSLHQEGLQLSRHTLAFVYWSLIISINFFLYSLITKQKTAWIHETLQENWGVRGICSSLEEIRQNSNALSILVHNRINNLNHIIKLFYNTGHGHNASMNIKISMEFIIHTEFQCLNCKAPKKKNLNS